MIRDAKEFDFSPEVFERMLRRIDKSLLDEYNIRFMLPNSKKYDVSFCLNKKEVKSIS
jgi:hypothetical protein